MMSRAERDQEHQRLSLRYFELIRDMLPLLLSTERAALAAALAEHAQQLVTLAIEPEPEPRKLWIKVYGRGLYQPTPFSDGAGHNYWKLADVDDNVVEREGHLEIHTAPRKVGRFPDERTVPGTSVTYQPGTWTHIEIGYEESPR